MNNTLVFMLLAILTGAMIPVQASLTTVLNKNTGNPILTAIVVFSVGLLVLLLLFLFSKSIHRLSVFDAPWSSYLGGVIIAGYILLIAVITPRLGVATSIGLIVTGQLLAALVIDHFGLFNLPIRTLTLTRAAGALLMLIGIYLVMKTKS